MKNKLKPFSRLTIIFILAVTIPGSILSYLSIRNITNLQELTERRILEEEEDLADLIYQKFQGKLSDICEEFEDYVSKTDEGDYASIRFSDTIDLIENPFIIDQDGEFLRRARYFHCPDNITCGTVPDNQPATGAQTGRTILVRAKQ